MSGVGVGSKEMRSVLVDNGQLAPLRLILNDLKTRVGYVIFFQYFTLLQCTNIALCRAIEVENRNAGKLPPAFGKGGMLNLEGLIGSAQPGTFTNHELFKSKASSTGPKTRSPITSGSCKEVRENGVGNSKGDGEGEDDEDDEDGRHGPSTLPPLLANAALVKAVSETQVAAAIEDWKMKEELSEVFKLFSVLVEPPPDLSLDAIEGLPNYLTKLHDRLVRLPGNGVRNIASHCWWILIGVFIGSMHMKTSSYALTGLCHHAGKRIKRIEWNHIPVFLEKSRKRIINWCPAVDFPNQGGHRIPKSRHALRNMVTMFFNPDPSRRLRIVPIEGA
jgi:hypothetical protein